MVTGEGETGNPLLFYFSREASCCDLYDHCGKGGGGLDFPGAFSLFYQHMVVWGGTRAACNVLFSGCEEAGLLDFVRDFVVLICSIMVGIRSCSLLRGPRVRSQPNLFFWL